MLGKFSWQVRFSDYARNISCVSEDLNDADHKKLNFRVTVTGGWVSSQPKQRPHISLRNFERFNLKAFGSQGIFSL